MRLTDQLSEQHLQGSGEQSPFVRQTPSDSTGEGSRGSGSSQAHRSGINDPQMKGLMSDVQADPVMSRLVNHLFSERVLGTVQQISSSANSLEEKVRDTVHYLEASEKERQAMVRKEAAKQAKGELKHSKREGATESTKASLARHFVIYAVCFRPRSDHTIFPLT